IVQLTTCPIQQPRPSIISTNALLLERSVKQVPPSTYLSFNIHLDGMRETHDRVVDRDGVFDTCVRMIGLLKGKGYRVQTNSTVYRETSAEEVEELVRFLASLGIDGMLVTPGYHYQVLENDIYLKKEEMPYKFKRVRDLAHDFKIINTPIYLYYLIGERDLLCS